MLTGNQHSRATASSSYREASNHEGSLLSLPALRPRTDLGAPRGRNLCRAFTLSVETIWATFNRTLQVDPDTALRRQETLMELVEERQLVVKTAVLKRVIDEWSSATLRRAQVAHSGVIWLSESGLVLSRVRPLPPA
jgi:hypothetical protein